MTELQKATMEALQAAGFPMTLQKIFDAVKARVPQLCDDSAFPCRYCGQKHPLWQHQVQWALQSLKQKGIATSGGRGIWVATTRTPTPAETPAQTVPEEVPSDVSLHESLKLKLKELGETLGKHCELEFRDPPYIYDVVWSDFQGLPPSHAFEVQDKGQVDGALGKLQHALDKYPCQGRLFLVVTGERDRNKAQALLHPFFAGAYHKLAKHTTMLTPEEVAEIHDWVVARQDILRRLFVQ